MSARGVCYICRTNSLLDPLFVCPSCPRSYHQSCWVFSNPSTPRPCPQCLLLCPRCLRSLDSEIACPRCRLKYHKQCEKLLSVHPGRQLCSLCVKELTEDRDEIVEKFGFVDMDGKRYYLIRFRSISLLHMSYVPESVCVSLPASENFPPAVQISKVSSWREVDNTWEGLVSLTSRPDSEATWEALATIEALSPGLAAGMENPPGIARESAAISAIPTPAPTPVPTPVPRTVIDLQSSSSDISSPRHPSPALDMPSSVVSRAYDVIWLFGYDLNDTEKTALYAFKRMKLEGEGVGFKELMEEMRRLLRFVCSHLGEEKAGYQGVEIEPRKVFFRNLEVAMVKKKVEEFHRTGDTRISSSALYVSSFRQLPLWTPRDDFLLLAAVLHIGYGNYQSLPPSLENLKNASEAAAAIPTSLDNFLQSRVRFLIYSLMIDEYEAVVAYRE